jgi:hypothetical protein
MTRSSRDRAADLLVFELFCGDGAPTDAKEPEIAVRVVWRIKQEASRRVAAPNCLDVAVVRVVREDESVNPESLNP